MHTSRYHSLLRVSALVTAFMLVFDSGILFPVTKQLSDNTYSYLAATGSGMFASVPPNEINTLTAQIAEQQRILDAREAALNEREIATRQYNDTASTDYSTYIISAILFLLTALIVLNFAMDFTRARSLKYENKTA